MDDGRAMSLLPYGRWPFGQSGGEWKNVLTQVGVKGMETEGDTPGVKIIDVHHRDEHGKCG